MGLKVYVSAPYTIGCQAKNVIRVMGVGDELLKLGHIPFLPHLSHFWDATSPKPYKVWLDYDLKWLEVCDILLRLDGDSTGSDIEVAVAERLGIPVYYKIEDIKPEERECPELRKIRGGDEIGYICNLVGKFCLKEYTGKCEEYDRIVDEDKKDKDNRRVK